MKKLGLEEWEIHNRRDSSVNIRHRDGTNEHWKPTLGRSSPVSSLVFSVFV